MQKRKDLNKADVFSEPENDSSLKRADAEIFGAPASGEKLVTDRIVARPIALDEIVPDPAQPRRVVPSAIKNAVVPPGVNPMQWRFDLWARAAFVETAGHEPTSIEQAHTLYRAIIAGEEVERPEKIGALESALLKVVELAASIRARGGLTNPITVWWDGAINRIETGERRWWAYNLLAYYYSHEQTFKRIPARVVDKFDAWRQADENAQRDDLNAIGRARQYAILLMELVRQEQPDAAAILQPFEAFEVEQDYYKQAAHPRVPRGAADKMMIAMGLKSRQALHQYRSLLLLTNDYWVRGDDEGWTVNDLLRIVKSFDISPDENVRASNNSTDEETPEDPTPQAPLAGQPVSQAGGGLGNKRPAPLPSGGGYGQPKPTATPAPVNVPYSEGQLVEVDGKRMTFVRHVAGTVCELRDSRDTPRSAVLEKITLPVWKPGERVLTHLGEGQVIKRTGSTTAYEVWMHNKQRQMFTQGMLSPANEPAKTGVVHFAWSDHAKDLAGMDSWIYRYKRMKVLRAWDELMFVVTQYGWLCLREDAKTATAITEGPLAHTFQVNSNEGLAYFVTTKQAMEIIAKYWRVAIYADNDPGLGEFTRKLFQYAAPAVQEAMRKFSQTRRVAAVDDDEYDTADPVFPQFQPGDKVESALGEGIVISQNGGMVSVKTDGRQKSHHAVDLTLVGREDAAPNIDLETGEILDDVPAEGEEPEIGLLPWHTLIVESNYVVADMNGNYLLTLHHNNGMDERLAHLLVSLMNKFAFSGHMEAAIHMIEYLQDGQIHPGLLADLDVLRDTADEIQPEIVRLLGEQQE